MKFEHHLSLKQSQKQVQSLSQRLIQRFRHFQQPYHELLDALQKETKENPFLLIEKADSLRSYGRQYNNVEGTGSVDRLSQLTESSTLKDVLLHQLDLESVSDLETDIATQLIDAIDSRGFIQSYSRVKESIVTSLGVSDRKVLDVLKIVQSFEPEGVGARSLKESLLIQIRETLIDDDNLQRVLSELVQNYLEDLGDGKLDLISKKMGIDEDEIKDLLSFIKDNLTPNPGAAYASETAPQLMIPSFRVIKRDAQWCIHHLEEEKGIQIKLDETALETLSDHNSEMQAYLKMQYERAKEWVETLSQRRHNLQALAQYIISKQTVFLEKGPFYLTPLLQQDIAKDLSLSPSFVSRIVSSKFIETPHGLFALKTLCPRNYFGKTAVRLEKIIQDLCHRYPDYSDRKLIDLLHEDGITMARRTVAKYRLKVGLRKR